MTTSSLPMPIRVFRQAHDQVVAEPPVPQPKTPEQELAEYEARHGALTAEQKERFFAAQAYKRGNIAEMHFAGIIDAQPQGLRVSMKSISEEDAYLTGILKPHDSRKCVASEVMAVGDGVRKYLDEKGIPDDTREQRSIWRKLRAWASGRGARPFARPMPGDHVFCLSTVADRASKTDNTVRFWTVHCDDVSLRWKKPG